MTMKTTELTADQAAERTMDACDALLSAMNQTGSARATLLDVADVIAAEVIGGVTEHQNLKAWNLARRVVFQARQLRPPPENDPFLGLPGVE
jgi:predicted RNA-binding protein associated with RNAse of E/G family